MNDLFLRLIIWLRCQNYIVELSHTIYSYECINVIYILYVNLVKLSFDPVTIISYYGDESTNSTVYRGINPIGL
ncbi:protein of unknown function [Petrocella atlantisensis]|uniref:Uncharacterized protein n=1 Tax=Petrocella atlantisensis TaxID=2173034 RepID=A0A3P7PGR2_9FIRM|nr:protein of unknown function [Petrocella atlantisensis]